MDQGYTGDEPTEAAAQQGIELLVVKHHQAKRGFVLLPRRWVWNVPSHGRPDSGDWHVTMNGWQLLSPVITG